MSLRKQSFKEDVNWASETKKKGKLMSSEKVMVLNQKVTRNLG